MKIELPIRWTEIATDPESIEAKKTRRIISGDEDDENDINTIFTYDNLVLDLDDIKIFHRYDDEHFILKTYDGDAYCVHLAYEQFMDLYQNLTGHMIMQVSQVAKET